MKESLRKNIRSAFIRIRKADRLLRGSRIIYRIYVLNLLIAAAATGMFGVYIYFDSFTKAKEQLFDNARKNLREVVRDMEAVTRRIETQSASLSMNESFRESVEGVRKAPGEIYEDYLKLDKLCAELENVDALYDISIVFTKYRRMMNDRNRTYLDDMGVAEKAQGRERFWLGSVEGIPGRFLHGIKTQTAGDGDVFLLFGIRERVYQGWLDRLRLYGEEKAFLGMQDHSFEKNDGDTIRSGIMTHILNSGSKAEDFIFQDGKEKYFVLYGQAGNSQIYAVSAFPVSILEKRAEDSVKGMFFILIPIFLMVLLASYVASVYLTSRLRHLVYEMNQMYASDEMQTMRKKKDDIDRLEEAFHELQGRMNQALEETREAEKKQRFAELSLLQGQINPHFLYNTLDSINWLAIKMNVPQISFIVENMSDYFRMGLNSGEQLTTLRQEICHITSYFNIQRFRFENKIRLCIDVPEELMETPMIVLSLQPVVENAILHGILADEQREGKIIVSAEAVQNCVAVYVFDDGIGMSEEENARLNRRIKKGEANEGGRHSFGLYNVNQRMQYYFGEEYGLDIISRKGEGTTCVLMVPLKVRC